MDPSHAASSSQDSITPVISEVTRRLIAAVGQTLVSYIAGSDNAHDCRSWAQYDGPKPAPETTRRLRFAHACWVQIREAEGEQVARMWFLGASPWIQDSTPAEAIRQGRFQDVSNAAQAVVDGTFSG